ncbi:conserved hypothetical protein [Burkholderiales bacterium 8X]|nr:conserved hypothetical protein [Burkholderiales bacterium 8X]
MTKDSMNDGAGFRRRSLLKAVAGGAAAGVAGWPSLSGAQAEYPAQAIDLIVPWPPGGPNDVVMRALANAASKPLGQPLVIINKPGAGGTLGTAAMAATAKPDGYTISQFMVSMLRYPHMQQVSYDPLKDFSYIIGIGGSSTGIIVRADAPWKSFKDMIEYAKAHPGEVSYASTGQGTTLHMAMEEVARQTGAKFLHVPYKGTSETTVALMGGQAMLQLDTIGVPMVRAGKARVLALFTEKRNPKLPQVPSLKELGIDVVATSPYGIAGPRNMSPAVVARLHDAFKQAMTDPQFVSTLEDNAQEPWYQSGADYARWAVQAYETEGRLVKAIGMGKPG